MCLMKGAIMRLLRGVLIVVAVALVVTVFAPAQTTQASAANASASYCSQYYVVRWGDSLARIARYFGTTVGALLSLNYIPNPNYIYAGQVLCIGGYTQPPPGNTYMVRYGDTLASIARYFGVNMYSIAQANGIYNLNRIYAGQVLVIPYY